MIIAVYSILGLFTLVSLATIGVVYGRKLSLAASLDLEAMREYRERMRKAALIEDRLARKLLTAKKNISTWITPLGRWLIQFAQNFFRWLKSLEEQYRRTARRPVAPSDAVTQQQSLSSVLQQAAVFVTEENYVEAEKKYIAAIAFDHSSIAAYRGLATLYITMKNYQHAVETLRFLEQLDPTDEAVWQDLGMLYQVQQQLEDALEAYEQALILGPNNPKNLDACIELAIANKLKYKAQNYYDKLKAVNPENKKLLQYQEQIAQL
ncbi:MAG: tetratricopeptide repeat protein [Candidatus Kerfeldbacteria bacterium]|nr:tetratricopeptide repeat protein [Candidatus Kerfeldbacteria bacterium]